VSEEGGHSTYFAFANAVPAVTSGQRCVSEVPDILAGRYRLERLLGAGGMGVVYRARDLLHEQYADPDPYLALKMLSEAFNGAVDASALLYSEFALMRRLHHPNILRPYTFEVDAAQRRAFITMELMRGMTLDQLLCERPLGLPWPELKAIAVPLLDALAYAHSRGVLHGDMKPSNVMLSEEGLRLFDFGLGLAEGGASQHLPNLNRERLNAWTPGYAAPELLDGAPLSAGADVYGVACVLYELASGKHPFQRLPAIQARDARLERALKAPRNLPRRCWPALRMALAFDPGQRRISAAQLRDALGDVSSWW
jgi:serine/threonine-protein kinase Stk1